MKRHTGRDRAVTTKWRPATRAIRGGTERTAFGETSEALFLTSGYTYDCAEDAAARFRREQPGMTYSRLQNPTVRMLEERIALLDGAEACRATATGMAAMTAALLSQLSAGDHVVAARALFGSCRYLVDELLPRFGIATTTVDGRDLDAWQRAIRPDTKVFFFETPSNPTLEIIDVRAVAVLAKAARRDTVGGHIMTVVDNAFASPALQRPIELGADVVAYSATKLMEGQGRVLAGAVSGTAAFVEETLMPYLRNTGPTLSPFNAWVVHKGLETLHLRARQQSANALAVASFLENRGLRVAYPGLASHPGHEIAAGQMDAGGTILSVFLGGGRERAHAVLDALELVDISNNIGDSRSLMCHPASTTHHRIGGAKREEVGITEDMLRLNVGLEDVRDVIEDLERALGQ